MLCSKKDAHCKKIISIERLEMPIERLEIAIERLEMSTE